MFGQVASSRESQHARYACAFNVLSDREQTRLMGRSHNTFIHILNENTLLKIFYLCRLVVEDEDEVGKNHFLKWRKGHREYWWYQIAHVCRKWRYLVLESASHLDLCLVCTYGTPVADMLAHSPPLPLTIDYGDEDREVTAEDEKGILLALQRRRRLRHIHLCLPSSNLQKLVSAIDGEFPALEYLYIKPSSNDDPGLILPETFKAPHLRHFAVGSVTYSPRVPCLLPPTPRFQSGGTISQCSRHCGTRLWRYAPFSSVVYRV
jgi:hypothetical protein